MTSILFLDDEHALRSVLTEVLRNEGFTVLDASDPVEARQACDAYGAPIDLAILDAKNGMTAAWSLKDAHPGIRFLFIGDAGWESRVRHESGLKPGWLSKPFTSGALLKAVRESGIHMPRSAAENVRA